jgi:hypothetical protein
MPKFLFLSFLFFSLNSIAFFPVDEFETTTIENPDLICTSFGVEEELDDLVLYIDVEGKRVAQSGMDELAAGTNTGLKIDVTSFARSRCPHCYTIRGSHTTGYDVTISTSGESFTSAKGTYSFGDITINFKCEAKN